MENKKDVNTMLAALREEIPIPHSQEKYMIRGIAKGLEQIEKKNAPEAGTSKGKNKN